MTGIDSNPFQFDEIMMAQWVPNADFALEVERSKKKFNFHISYQIEQVITTR